MRKEKFRKDCLKQLKKASLTKVYHKDKKIIEKLSRHIDYTKAKNIMLYIPLNMEVNVFPLLKQLRMQKKNLYVPFMQGSSFRLVSYRLPLKKKRFGVKEPLDSQKYRKKQIDLAIVPIVGTDVTCRRVGFGKGMYDRFFQKNKQHINEVIFVARSLCYSPKMLTDNYDVQADMICVP